jgi:hypothetical protein
VSWSSRQSCPFFGCPLGNHTTFAFAGSLRFGSRDTGFGFVLVVLVFTNQVASSSTNGPTNQTADQTVSPVNEGSGGSTRSGSDNNPFRLWSHSPALRLRWGIKRYEQQQSQE